MTSDARRDLLDGLDAFRASISEPYVISSLPGSDFVRRGLAIAIYNLLESFVGERCVELALHVNGGHLHFSDLPAKLQSRAVRNVLNVANTRSKYIEGPDLPIFAQGLGKSMMATVGPVQLSDMTWAWAGSNMGQSDLASVLASLHFKGAFASIRSLSGRLGFPTTDPLGNPLDLAKELTSFAQERHRAAHRSKHSVSVMWLGSVVDLVMKYAICFDAFASIASHELRLGSLAFSNDERWGNDSRVVVRTVVPRPKGAGEYVEGRKNALKVHSDVATATAAAASRSVAGDLLVVIDSSRRIVSWSVPSVS
jgi:hypothetical protein